MADYPILSPTLTALNDTKENPTPNEAANKLSHAMVQTRVWLYDFLSTLIDNAGKIKPTALASGSVPFGLVRGSDENAGGQQREILQGTISTPDFRDDAVTSPKIADGGVETDNIADDAITSAKILDAAVRGSTENDGEQREIEVGTVSTPDLRDLAVSTAKLAAGAVTTAKIGDSQITTAKIANNAVDGSKLPAGTGGQLLLHNGTTWVPTTITGGLALSSAGVASVSISSSSVGFVRISERQSAGSHAGASSAASWTQLRGVTTAWTIDEQTVSGTVAVGSAGQMNIQRNGTYLLSVSVPGYSVGLHKMRLHIKTTPAGSFVDYYGSCESAPAGVSSRSVLTVVVTVTGASSGSPAVFEIQHFTEVAKATNGLGIAVGASAGEERYTIIEMLLLSNG
jgi:hypothetical protein